MTVPAFLLDWARLPGPRRLLREARGRLEAGRLGARSRLEVSLSTPERREVGRLLPASWLAGVGPVLTRDLRAGLAEHGATLEELLEAVGGPLRDLVAERRSARDEGAADREAAVAAVSALVVGRTGGDPADIAGLIDRWVVGRPTGGGSASGQAAEMVRVVEAIPEAGGVPLAALAASVFGDAHALDRTQPLGRAVARLLAVEASVREGADWVDPLGSAEAWRAAWASGGVTCDAVSSQVLVLNLPLVGDAPAVALSRAAPGEPTWLTLRSLSAGLGLAGEADVFVCENPSILEAAADELGASAPPMVCTFGRPTAAVWALLRAITPPAWLRVRADGDATGWGIVNSLLGEFDGASPWRMPSGTTAYEEELLGDLLGDLARSVEDG